MNISGRDILAILPLVITGGSIVVLMTVIAFVRSHILTFVGTLISLTISLFVIFFFHEGQSRQVTQLLIVDGYAKFFLVLIYCTSIIITLQSYAYIKNKKAVREEYYIFLLTALLGSAVLVCSNNLASLFIGIELLSISLYILIAYPCSKQNLEAGIKYFVTTAVAMAFLLFGMALIYGATKTMQFKGISSVVTGSNQPVPKMFMMGAGLFLIGLFFKLAVVPFHFWIPDVFEGSSAPVTGFLATVSKGAVFAVLARYFSAIDIVGNNSLFYMLGSIAVVSMFLGNITALLQDNVKRILAYSSIGHFGYLLITVIAGGSTGLEASVFYLTAYFITILTAFSIITFLSSGESEFENIEDYKGLASRHPFFSAGLATAMFSLAGIPLTAGFIAKFYVITAGAKTQLWVLLAILVINSVIGLFYYLRIAVYLYLPSATKPEPEETSRELRVTSHDLSYSWMGGMTFVFLFISLFYLGIWPATIVRLISMLTKSLN